MRLTSLPQGYTNSMQEFCRRTSHMVSPIKDDVKVFVDDIAGKGPKSRYSEETLAENPDIRRFVYEGLTVLRNTLILVIRAGVTISGTKFVGATPELDILGATVSIYHSMEVGIHHGILLADYAWGNPYGITDIP